jgi:hypothetical protein
VRRCVRLATFWARFTARLRVSFSRLFDSSFRHFSILQLCHLPSSLATSRRRSNNLKPASESATDAPSVGNQARYMRKNSAARSRSVSFSAHARKNSDGGTSHTAAGSSFHRSRATKSRNGRSSCGTALASCSNTFSKSDGSCSNRAFRDASVLSGSRCRLSPMFRSQLASCTGVIGAGLSRRRFNHSSNSD